MAAKKRTQASSAPAGFSRVENQLIGFWKPDQVGENIQGVIESAIRTPGKNGRTNLFYALRLTSDSGGSIVDNDGVIQDTVAGARVGVGGAMIANFMQGRIGQEVYLVYQGLGVAKKGRNAAKLYDCYERPSADGHQTSGEDDLPY